MAKKNHCNKQSQRTNQSEFSNCNTKKNKPQSQEYSKEGEGKQEVELHGVKKKNKQIQRYKQDMDNEKFLR